MQSGLIWRNSESISAIERGARTGSPRDLANSWTGLGVIFLPRPAGAGGWVMTAAISWPEFSKPFKDDNAVAGVPANTSFTLKPLG
jgi:hypothetical protein